MSEASQQSVAALAVVTEGWEPLCSGNVSLVQCLNFLFCFVFPIVPREILLEDSILDLAGLELGELSLRAGWGTPGRPRGRRVKDPSWSVESRQGGQRGDRQRQGMVGSSQWQHEKNTGLAVEVGFIAYWLCGLRHTMKPL